MTPTTAFQFPNTLHLRSDEWTEEEDYLWVVYSFGSGEPSDYIDEDFEADHYEGYNHGLPKDELAKVIDAAGVNKIEEVQMVFFNLNGECFAYVDNEGLTYL